MVSEKYPCYVRIVESTDTSEVMELPSEADGKVLLTTITAQFPEAIGLKFKSESGSWRGVRVTNGAVEPPLEGWGYTNYFITVAKKAEKRKQDDGADGATPNKSKRENSDLIVLGLPYSATESDMREYFKKFGDLTHCEVKYGNTADGKRSKGFGFIRFENEAVVEEVLSASHVLG